jgi:acyl-CoA synthetase (AMP-forming)/AMP-acid ligase II
MWQTLDVTTVPEILRFWANRAAESVALINEREAITFSSLDQRSSRTANRLLQANVKPGDHVGYLGLNSVGFFDAWFGAGKIGCAFAPFNWRLAPSELAEIIDDARPSIVFVDSGFREKAQSVEALISTRCELVFFDRATDEGGLQEWARGASAKDPAFPIQAGNPALIAYTSGTTGRPKGVVLSHGAISNSFVSAEQEPAMRWTRDDVILLSMPNFHLGGSCIALQALYNGSRITILSSFDVAGALAKISRDRATIAPLVPAALQMILDDPRLSSTDLSSLRTIMYFGSAIGAETATRAQAALRCSLVQHYGTTETWIATILRPEDHDPTKPERLASCGVAIPRVQIRVVDEAEKNVAPNVVGQVVIKCPTAFSGYLGQRQATEAVMRDGWYMTGDLGFLDADGYLTLVDRCKDMIVSGGENVYSVEVERALMRHPEVAAAAVIGTPDPKWGEKVTAFVVTTPGATVSTVDLGLHCRKFLAAYKSPKEIIFEAALPMTASGKIQKSILRRRFWGDGKRAIG